MEDVSTAFLHGVADLFLGLSMGVRQVRDEFLAKEGDLALRDGNVSKRKLVHDFLDTETPDKQGIARVSKMMKKRARIEPHQLTDLIPGESGR
jgi:hypothetical protein